MMICAEASTQLSVSAACPYTHALPMQQAIAGPAWKSMQSNGVVHDVGCASGVASPVDSTSPSPTLPASSGLGALLDWQAAANKTASVVRGPTLDMHDPRSKFRFAALS